MPRLNISPATQPAMCPRPVSFNWSEDLKDAASLDEAPYLLEKRGGELLHRYAVLRRVQPGPARAKAGAKWLTAMCGQGRDVAPLNSGTVRTPHQLRAQTFRRARHHTMSLCQLREDERHAWAAQAISAEMALFWVRAAFEDISPSWATAVEALLAQGRLRWGPAEQWADAFCAHTESGPLLQVPQPADLQGLALLAHELGHAVHQMLRPGEQQDRLRNEMIAIGCERWAVQRLMESTANLQLGQACAAWLKSREDELVGRHTMLHHFECELVSLASRGQPLSAAVINNCWLKRNSAFFGQSVRFSPEFAWAWTEVQHLFLQPGSLWTYPAAWLKLGKQIDPRKLRDCLDEATTRHGDMQHET